MDTYLRISREREERQEGMKFKNMRRFLLTVSKQDFIIWVAVRSLLPVQDNRWVHVFQFAVLWTPARSFELVEVALRYTTPCSVYRTPVISDFQ